MHRALMSSLAICLAICLAILTGPRPSLAQANPSADQRLRVPSGWQVHQGRKGLLVMHPPGWRVRQLKQGVFMVVSRDAGGAPRALAWVRPFDQPAPPEEVLGRLGRNEPDLFPGLGRPTARTLSQQPAVAEARLDYTLQGRPWRGAALCIKQGSRGVIYVAAARADQWPSLGPQALAILSRFLYSTGEKQPPPPAAGLPPMERWQDPKEQAFSLLVPKGWQVSGGLKRFHAVDVRPELVAMSPDRSVVVRIGDADIPPMALASAWLARTGFPEGSIYSPGYGLKQLVMRYLPGAQFATRYYLPRRVGKVSQARANNFRRAAEQANALHRRNQTNITVDMGEVFYTAQNQGRPLAGYLFVQTSKVELPSAPGMGNWHVDMIFGYLARPDREDLAKRVLAAMAASFRISPEWMKAQNRLTGQTSGTVTETNRQIQGIIAEIFRNKQQSRERSAGRYIRGAVRGTVLVEDPNTGRRMEVPGGSNYYWQSSGGGPGVGAQTHTRPVHPNHWFQRLTILD